MKYTRLFVMVLVSLLALSACAPVALNAGTRVITGGDYTLNSGETYPGSLLILGGNATLQSGSTVNGDLTVVGGNTNANGVIGGSVALIGGNVNLGSNALVRGNVSVRGGNVNRASGARVLGSYSNAAFEVPFTLNWFDISPVGQVGWLIFRTLAQAALAMLVFMFIPEHVGRTVRALVDQPVTSGLAGLLALVAAVVLIVVMAVTIILIPLSLLIALLVAVADFFGWTALGVETGRRLDQALALHMPPVLYVGLGMWLFGMLMGAIEFIPFVGWLPSFVATVVAIGAVALTRFGTRSYTPAPTVPMPPTLPKATPAA